MIDKNHEREFKMYDSFTTIGKTTTKLVYVMGVLSDVCNMTSINDIKTHITDVREMLATITKETAQLEGIPVVENKVNSKLKKIPKYSVLEQNMKKAINKRISDVKQFGKTFG